MVPVRDSDLRRLRPCLGKGSGRGPHATCACAAAPGPITRTRTPRRARHVPPRCPGRRGVAGHPEGGKRSHFDTVLRCPRAPRQEGVARRAATAPGRPRPAGLVASTAAGVQADSRPCAGRRKTAACFLGRRGCILTFLQESGGPRHSPGRAGGTFASFSLSHKETAFVFNHRRKSYCSWADRGNLDVKIKYKERKIKRNLLTLSQARYPVFGLCF